MKQELHLQLGTANGRDADDNQKNKNLNTDTMQVVGYNCKMIKIYELLHSKLAFIFENQLMNQ